MFRDVVGEGEKEFLVEEIRKIKKLPIKKTKLLFKFDKNIHQNPHHYIDNIPNIVIIITLSNHKVIAAFTQTAFSNDYSLSSSSTNITPLRSNSRIHSNKGLIIDLTAKISFNNKTQNNTVVYDENSLIWGNDELVIRNTEPAMLYSSFGC